MAGMTISPSTPTFRQSRARSPAIAVVYSATPATTGTRLAAASTAADRTWRFSSGASDVPSPTVPQMIRPETPSRISPSITRWVAGMSTEKSSRNCVVTAGKTPRQPMRAIDLSSNRRPTVAPNRRPS